MPAPSAHPTKERRGAGAKSAASRRPFRSTTPISDRVGGSCCSGSCKDSASRPGPKVPAVAPQKPATRVLQRTENPVSVEADPRLRRSMSSVVGGGRSTSPSSDLSRAKQRAPRAQLSRSYSVSGWEKGFMGSTVLEKYNPKKAPGESNAKVSVRASNNIAVNDCKVSAESRLNMELEAGLKSKGEETGLTDTGVLGSRKEADLRSSLVNVGESSGDCGGLNSNVKVHNKCNELDKECEGVSNLVPSDVHMGVKVLQEKTMYKYNISEGSNGGVVDLGVQNLQREGLDKCIISKGLNGGVCVDLGVKDPQDKPLDGSTISEGLGVGACEDLGVPNLQEKGLDEGVAGAQVGNKYPSTLHQRLALLEGKVKRIASDIKQTKEMLDLNNPDASKVVLSNIQEKISGIERSMGHVTTSYPDGVATDLIKTVENGDGSANEVEYQSKQLENAHISAKGMNAEELEARLFPHHKLLRNRISLKASSDLQSHQSVSTVSSSESKAENKPPTPIGENPIALEFLASQNIEKSRIFMGNEPIVLDMNEVQEMDDFSGTTVPKVNMFNRKLDVDVVLTTDRTIVNFDDQENEPAMMIDEGIGVECTYPLKEIRQKTSTGGWFVSEGEAVLLAHDDGSCSLYDIANDEGKAEYKPPTGVLPNVWRDCWVTRATGADGCSGKYVVAASAGNTMESGFCSWDFYTKDVQAFHIEHGNRTANSSSRSILGSLPNAPVHRKHSLSAILSSGTPQRWYKPCGPLIISTASCQRVVKLYDIRDGEQIMKWEAKKPVLTMDYSSPLQWRNRGKVVIAETDAISLFDVNSQSPQAIFSISSSGQKISALHVNNSDAELGGGIRQRACSESNGNEGVFCTPDSINVLDSRKPSGIALKIPKLGVSAQSVSSRSDSIFLGCTNLRSGGKKQLSSEVLEFSLRKQKLVSTYALPPSSAPSHYQALTQVWGNSQYVMGVCGLGLFVFDALKDGGMQPFSLTTDYGNPQSAREVIGPNDLVSPSFDYSSSCALLISRDRPALWRHIP